MSPSTVPTGGWLAGCTIIEAKHPGPVFRKPPTKIVIHRGRSGGDIAHYFKTTTDGRVVSGHFEVRRDGQVRQCVSLLRQGYHCKGHNASSIGIENQGPIDSPWTDEHIDALILLIRKLCNAYPSITHIYSHRRLDLKRMPASARHRDPGANFPWDKLTAAFPALSVLP